jgi:hypothetical protein
MERGEYVESMSRRQTASLLGVLAVGIGGGGLLGGCGSSTKTVEESSSVPVSPSTSTSVARTSSSRTTASSTSTRTATSTTAAATATRTESAPAFTRQTSAAPATAVVAAGVVRTHGYTPEDISQYHPEQTLRVLVGTRVGSTDGHGQQAFFFLGGHYIGTDTSQPSATIRVVSQSDTEVTLAYPLYRAHDALCCPSGGEAKVSFQLNNGMLTPLQAIPPASSQTGLSRN